MIIRQFEEREVICEVNIEVTSAPLAKLLHEWFERGDYYWFRDIKRFHCQFIDSEVPYCSAAQAVLDEKGFADIKVLSLDRTRVRTIRLNRRRLVQGLHIFSGRYPLGLLDVLRMEADITTVRLFAQCVVYGDEVMP